MLFLFLTDHEFYQFHDLTLSRNFGDFSSPALFTLSLAEIFWQRSDLAVGSSPLMVKSF